jgi:hypothetical protein
MNWRCWFGGHMWWAKAMTPQEIDECVNAGAPWPPLTEICMFCRKERTPDIKVIFANKDKGRGRG